MAITLLSSTPAEGATDYYLNKSVELTFDKAIASSSLTDNVFSIIDIDSGTCVPLTISFGADSNARIILLPSTSFRENTQYRIIITGTSSGLGYTLTAADADTLATTLFIEFGTGTTVYKIDTTLEKEISNLTLEGDLFLPTNVKALGYDFTVSRVRPKNNLHAVSPTLTGDSNITFTFSKNLMSGAEYDDWVEVDVFPLLNDVSYLASGTSFGEGTIPSYTVTGLSNQLIVQFSTELPKNVGVQINLLQDITSVDGDQYGGKLRYSINTELYPEVCGVNTIEREIREVVDVYPRDYIGALLFKNSIWLWEKLGRSFGLDSVPYAAKQYITYSTILDLMEDREYYKFVLAGTRRQLGDLGVSVDNIIGRIAMKVAKYKEAKDVALESLKKGWQFKVGTSIAAYSEMADQVNRLWYDINGRYTDSTYSYHQEDLPISNVAINRHARHNNPIW